MRFSVLTSILVACGGDVVAVPFSSAINDYVNDDQTSNDDSNDNDNDDATFELSSTAFTSGGEIPVIHACEDLGGNNYSPQLSWQNAPENTDSFVIIVDDETAHS